MLFIDIILYLNYLYQGYSYLKYIKIHLFLVNYPNYLH